MPVAVRHFMFQVLIIVALYKFHALILQPEIVSVFSRVSARNIAYASVVENGNTVQTVYNISKFVFTCKRMFIEYSNSQKAEYC